MIRLSSAMKFGATLAFAAAWASLSSPAAAAPGDKARISGLVDAAFGTVILTSDRTVRQNVCAFSDSATAGYSVTASGSGAASAFTLTTGSFTVPYEVQWAGTSNQTSGTSLTSGSIAHGFTSNAANNNCGGNGPTATATLIVILRASALGSARAGSYSGTLSITLAPE
jgi:hypothetical protein